MTSFQLEPGKEPFVGEVRVVVPIENYLDLELAQRGLWDPRNVRRTEIEVTVDTGSTLLALPEDVVDRLGLRRIQQLPSFLADGTEVLSWIAGVAQIHVLGRTARVDCVVMPMGSPALLGQIPLEYLDLLVDCKRKQLVVNPLSPDAPHYKL
jgi:clan AA aspartic protease